MVRFPWHVAFTAVPVFLLLLFPDQRLYFVKNILYEGEPTENLKNQQTIILQYLRFSFGSPSYTHISDCVQTVHELSLLPNNTANETFVHKSEGYEVLTGFLLLHRAYRRII